MLSRMQMRGVVALVGILAIIMVGTLSAQDEPCEIDPESWGVTIDSVQMTDQAGYTAAAWTGWDPAYIVTEFGSWDPILMTVNYIITDVDPLPCKVWVAFKAGNRRLRIVGDERHTPGSYSVTEMIFPGGVAPGHYQIRCFLRAKHGEDLVGWGKAVCGVTILNQ